MTTRGEKVYRWVAECPIDDEELLKRIPSDELIEFRTVQRMPNAPTTPTILDCLLSEAKVRSLTLDQLRDIMRDIPDGHVMVQTVQPKDRFTGERNFDL